MTAGAVVFAAFALWWINRRPGQAAADQPGQAARDSGLAAWVENLDRQTAEFTGSIDYSLAANPYRGIFGMGGKR